MFPFWFASFMFTASLEFPVSASWLCAFRYRKQISYVTNALSGVFRENFRGTRPYRYAGKQIGNVIF